MEVPLVRKLYNFASYRACFAIAWLVILCPAQSISQWYPQQVPTNQLLKDVYFADSLNGWVASLGGIFRTGDGGANWTLQDSSLVTSLGGINSETCWAASNNPPDSSFLLYTSDGGIRWSKLYIDSIIGGPKSFRKICFIDALTGWVVVRDTSPRIWLLRTDDGGLHWSSSRLPGYGINLCSFVDRSHGWFAGDWSYVYSTTDGGQTWDSASVYAYSFKMDLQFINNQIGWLSNDGPTIGTTLFKTTDAGKTWNFNHYFECSDVSTYLFFVDTCRGWVAQFTCINGSHMEILHTTDGGASWSVQYTYAPSFFYRPRRVFFVNQYNGWIIGDQGLIFHTTNGGLTDVDKDYPSLPTSFALEQNYPNPFNSSTVVSYKISEQSFVSIEIYDIFGDEVCTLYEGIREPGTYKLGWDGRDRFAKMVASGTYISRMSVYSFLQKKSWNFTVKMILIK